MSGAKAALAVALLAWLVLSGRLDGQAFRALDGRAWLWITLATLFQCAMVVTMAGRWRSWLQVPLPANEAQAPLSSLSWREALIVTGRGVCLGAWTPAGLGLDGIRAAHALRRFRDIEHRDAEHENHLDEGEGEANKALSLRSLLRGGGGRSGGAARVVGLASLLDRVAALAVLVALSVPFLLSRLSRPVSEALVLGALATALATALWRVRIRGKGQPWRWRDALSAIAWTVGTHGANILAQGAILEALAPGLGLWRALRLAFEVGPIIILSSALPLTPLGLGVTDATGEALLARHGLSCGGEAVMLARATWLGVCLLAGTAFWTRQSSDKVAR